MELTQLRGGRGLILTVAAGTKVSFLDLANGGRLVHEHKMPIHFRDEGGGKYFPLSLCCSPCYYSTHDNCGSATNLTHTNIYGPSFNSLFV